MTLSVWIGQFRLNNTDVHPEASPLIRSFFYTIGRIDCRSAIPKSARGGSAFTPS